MFQTVLFLLAYFLPAIVGFYRKHHQARRILPLTCSLAGQVWTGLSLWPGRQRVGGIAAAIGGNATSQRVSRGFHRLALFLASIPLLVGIVASVYMADASAKRWHDQQLKLVRAQAKLEQGVAIILSSGTGTHRIGLPDGSVFEINGATDDATAICELRWGRFQKLFFPENPETGELVRMYTGVSLGEHLENRLGILGPDFRVSLATEDALEQEGKIFDKLPPERLAQVTTELDPLAKRLFLERGDPDEWKDAEIENAAELFALRLIAGMAQVQSHRSCQHEQRSDQRGAGPRKHSLHSLLMYCGPPTIPALDLTVHGAASHCGLIMGSSPRKMRSRLLMEAEAHGAIARLDPRPLTSGRY